MRIVVLISGNGTNLQALIDSDINIDLVVSNRPDAYGLTRASQSNIKTAVVDHRRFSLREKFDEYLSNAIGDADLIILAGFMRILSPSFVNKYAKIINIHPSLLPKYKGLNTHQRVLDAKDDKHGCTVHYVDEGLDSGSIIAQRSLFVNLDDTPDTLHNRVQKLEHILYPQVVKTLLLIDNSC